LQGSKNSGIRDLRKVTESNPVFPADDALLKMLYWAMMDITKKWIRGHKDWGMSIRKWKSIFCRQDAPLTDQSSPW